MSAHRQTRISLTRVTVLLVVTMAVAGGLFWLIRPSVSATTSPGATRFAPYVDVTATPSYPFETPSGPAQEEVTLAFVVADRAAPCTPTWGTYYTLDQAASRLQLDRRISQLRLVGGEPRVSFGGQANNELAVACTDGHSLAAAYESVVERYALKAIDFDVEGAALEDAAASARRAKAVRVIQDHATKAGRQLDVWLTVPVDQGGLPDTAQALVATMLDAGVDLAGVNGMTMDFGSSKPVSVGMGDAVISAARSLHDQVQALYAQHATALDAGSAWSHVGITPMVGQNDVPGEVFGLSDAAQLNEFARAHGVGLLSMWDLNRDVTCGHPLPAVLTVVQNTCSGVDQQGVTFADTLSAHTGDPMSAGAVASAKPATPSPQPTSPEVVDDPATSPFPIWDPLGTYPTGTKTVWKRQVYQAKFWTSGFAPDKPVASSYDTPWTLLGPVLPGDKPAPLPTAAPNTYPQWNPMTAYVAGARVQVGLVPYQAKWWTQGQRPGGVMAGGSPWVLVYPS
jgi:chitinase